MRQAAWEHTSLREHYPIPMLRAKKPPQLSAKERALPNRLDRVIPSTSRQVRLNFWSTHFPRYTLMQFVHALDAIFEFTAVVRKLLSHLIDATRHVATERGPDGDNLADFALVGGHQFLDLGRSWYHPSMACRRIYLSRRSRWHYG